MACNNKPPKLQFCLYSGDNYARRVTWLNNDHTPHDLTGATALMQFRTEATNPDPPLLELTESTGITLGGTAGTIDIVLTGAQTAGLPADAVTDLQITESDASIVTIFAGNVENSADVSR